MMEEYCHKHGRMEALAGIRNIYDGPKEKTD